MQIYVQFKKQKGVCKFCLDNVWPVPVKWVVRRQKSIELFYVFKFPQQDSPLSSWLTTFDRIYIYQIVTCCIAQWSHKSHIFRQALRDAWSFSISEQKQGKCQQKRHCEQTPLGSSQFFQNFFSQHSVCCIFPMNIPANNATVSCLRIKISTKSVQWLLSHTLSTPSRHSIFLPGFLWIRIKFDFSNEK